MILMGILQPSPMKKFIIPSASSDYPTQGKAYMSERHKIEYLPSLVRAGSNYYNSKYGIVYGVRMSTAAEELAIQRGMEMSGKDPRRGGEFKDIFTRNGHHWYAWQWTETGLRVPAGRDPNKYETDEQGRKYWAREVLIGKDVIGEVLVPEGNWRVVTEWDEVSGIPKVTEEIGRHHTPYISHFRFNPDTQIDNISGHNDVAVTRGSHWLRGEDERCLAVYADTARSFAHASVGFRPVRGSWPKIEKKLLESGIPV